jgi:transcriptional regulator with XRE-family HTH domain
VSKISVRFGKKVKELRKLLGLTQQELAEKVGISKDYIGLIERGLRSPSLEMIEKIAVALKVTITSLFEYPPDK